MGGGDFLGGRPLDPVNETGRGEMWEHLPLKVSGEHSLERICGRRYPWVLMGGGTRKRQGQFYGFIGQPPLDLAHVLMHTHTYTRTHTHTHTHTPTPAHTHKMHTHV